MKHTKLKKCSECCQAQRRRNSSGLSLQSSDQYQPNHTYCNYHCQAQHRCKDKLLEPLQRQTTRNRCKDKLLKNEALISLTKLRRKKDKRVMEIAKNSQNRCKLLTRKIA